MTPAPADPVDGGPTVHVGMVFGRLTVVRTLDGTRWGSVVWLCSCACGARVQLGEAKLLAGMRTACLDCEADAKRVAAPRSVDVRPVELLRSSTAVRFGNLAVIKGGIRDGDGPLRCLVECVICATRLEVPVGDLVDNLVRTCPSRCPVP